MKIMPTKFFVDVFLPKNFPESPNIDELRFLTDARIQILTFHTFALALAIVTIIRLIEHRVEDWTFYLQFVILASLLAANLLVRRRILLGFHVLAFVIYPIVVLRLYLTGGLEAPALPMLAVLPLLITVLKGVKTGMWFALISTLVILAFSIIEVPAFSNTQAIRAVVLVAIVVFTTLFASILIKERDVLENQIRIFELKKSALTVVGRLAHEINNPLSIIVGHSELVGTEGFDNVQESAETIAEQAHRISHLIQELLKIAESSDVGEFLKEHKDEVYITDVLPGNGKRT
jgi:signal transduction histidine kinase